MLRTMMSVYTAFAVCLFPFSAGATCSRTPYLQTKPIIDGFMIRPEGVLETYPRGGDELVAEVRDLVATDPETTLGPVSDLIAQANQYQRRDIGKGLGMAARQCDQAGEPWRARQLQDTVRVKQDRTVTAAFMGAYKQPVAVSAPSVAYDRPTNPLGNGGVSSPDTDVFGTHRLSDPFAPLR